MEAVTSDGRVEVASHGGAIPSKAASASAPEFQKPAVLALMTACFGALFSAVPIMSMFPIILEPIGREFGWGRGQASVLILVFTIATAVATPLLGHLADRRGARPVALVAVPILGIVSLALSQVGSTAPALFALFVLLGFACPMLVLNGKVIAGWFDRRRGIALTILGLAISLISAGLLQVNRLLLEAHGWRSIFLVYGAVALVAGLPLLWLFYRERIRPERTSGASLPGCSASEARRSGVFWMVVAATTLNVAVWLAMQTHMIALLTDRGLSLSAAVNILSMAVIGSFVVQPLAGYLLDRFNTPRVAVPYMLACLAGLVTLLFADGYVGLLAAAVLLTAGAGGELTMMPYLLTRFFGLRSFSELYGTYFLVGSFGMSVSPFFMGATFDRTGSYQPALFVFGGMIALSLLLILLLPAYRFAAHRPDVEPIAGPDMATI